MSNSPPPPFPYPPPGYVPPTGQSGGFQYPGYPPQQGFGVSSPPGFPMPPPPRPQVYAPTSEDEFAASPFSDKQIRRRFISKVYSILSVQLAVTAAIVCLFIFVPAVRTWVRTHVWFYYLAYATFFATYIALACCDSVRRKFPGNFIALSVFTLALSYMAGTLSAMYTVNSVLVCLLITLSVCVSVSVAAICCPCDITKCQAAIAILSIIFLFFGLAVGITYLVAGYNQVLHTVYGGIAAILFTIYLAYDTQLIIGEGRYELDEEEYLLGALQLYLDIVFLFMIFLGLYLAFDTQMIMGGRKHELSPEEYIYGAMQLYVDVVNLFMIFLSLFGTGSSD